MKTALYIKLYSHYKALILEGALAAAAKLPSIKRCAALFGVSKTTVEAAYLQLAAEGYVTARPQSGYYVTALPLSGLRHTAKSEPVESRESALLYDLSSTSVDRDGFDFELWQRYIKSALRDGTRLLSYGEPQGEYDLRCAIASFAADSRAVLCAPSQVVVGAGVQSLLHILCALAADKRVYFIDSIFEQGAAIFRDHGRRCELFCGDYSEIARDSIIYVSPSHSTPVRPPMPVGTRAELLRCAREKNCLIIEDDYDSEFSFYGKPVPSLQSLDGGDRVLYIGTFSKLLLPSLRISFMALPRALTEKYQQIAPLYNQTASKTEQLALCRFIRDGKLGAQIRKARKHYLTKNRIFAEALSDFLADRIVKLRQGNGIFIYLELRCEKELSDVLAAAKAAGIKLRPLEKGENGIFRLLLCCSTVPSAQLLQAAKLLSAVLTA